MEELERYGFVIDSGYVGRLEDESFREFSTEEEYSEYVAEYNSSASE